LTARGDAPLCLSKSCSDKLSLKQCSSVLSSLASLLIHPRTAYIDTLILPHSQYVQSALDRAFSPSGRMSGLRECRTSDWKGGYSFHPFKAVATTREFPWSRRGHLGVEKFIASNISAISTPHIGETLINGILQGHKMSHIPSRGASLISRRGLWSAVAAILSLPNMTMKARIPRDSIYKEIKSQELLRPRNQVKTDVKTFALKNWKPNEADDGWTLPP
jgi:tRNA-specific adenosine deaminase 1